MRRRVAYRTKPRSVDAFRRAESLPTPNSASTEPDSARRGKRRAPNRAPWMRFRSLLELGCRPSSTKGAPPGGREGEARSRENGQETTGSWPFSPRAQPSLPPGGADDPERSLSPDGADS